MDLDKRTIFSMTCLQCEAAACLEVCPTGALRRDPVTRAVIVDKTLCRGCKVCMIACPFGCIHFEGKRCVAAKCDLCQGNPKCVKNCMAKALYYCDIDNLAAVKQKERSKHLPGQAGFAKEHSDDES